MSPYHGNNQNQGPPNGASPGTGPGAGLYSASANQNAQNGSQIYNQNQSSAGYPGYSPNTATGYTPAPGQSYYNNQSPTHQFHGSYGGPQSTVRLSPPPASSMGMMLGARIPHPSINSPNQNNIKTDTAPADLKPGMSPYHGQPAPAQGYNSSSSYGYNGYGTARPLVSPMSPHQGRLNISPGGPNLSPRDGPPNMSPHPSLYSHSQPSSSPGPSQVAYHGSYQAQYSEYFAKQQPAGHSPGQAGQPGYQGDNSDKLSDAQSNAGSVRSAETEPETGACPGSGSLTDSQPVSDSGLTSLTTVKKEEDRPETDRQTGSESDNDNKFTPKSESEDSAVKTEAGSYFEQHKDFTLKANQTLIDGIDSIPELPEIPELKYEDVSEMNRLHHNSNHNQEDKDHKDTPPGLSPDNLKTEGGGLGRGSWEEGGEEEGFQDNMAGAWPHMQGRILLKHLYKNMMAFYLLSSYVSSCLATSHLSEARSKVLAGICNSCLPTNRKVLMISSEIEAREIVTSLSHAPMVCKM